MAVTRESPVKLLLHAPNNQLGRSTGNDETYQRIRQDILAGHLLPSERLVEMDLAQRYAAGRAAVRTALALLEQEGLVEHEPNRGARVRVISETEAIEILEARAVIEGLAAHHAALTIGAGDLAQLRSIEAQMHERFAANDLLGISALNSQLHAQILRIANHTTARRLIDRLHSQLVRHHYRTVLVPGRAAQSLAEHHTIIEALAAHNAAAAEAAMRIHLSHVVEALRQAARSFEL